jgi:hypothetical protein
MMERRLKVWPVCVGEGPRGSPAPQRSPRAAPNMRLRPCSGIPPRPLSPPPPPPRTPASASPLTRCAASSSPRSRRCMCARSRGWTWLRRSGGRRSGASAWRLPSCRVGGGAACGCWPRGRLGVCMQQAGRLPALAHMPPACCAPACSHRDGFGQGAGAGARGGLAVRADGAGRRRARRHAGLLGQPGLVCAAGADGGGEARPRHGVHAARRGRLQPQHPGRGGGEGQRGAGARLQGCPRGCMPCRQCSSHTEVGR